MRAVEGVFARGVFLRGPETAAFERELADSLGIGHAVAVGSGTDALTLALRASEIRPGDEVITVALTAAATAAAIEDAGCVPRFVDVDPHTRCMDPAAAAAAIGPRTAAIVPVHLHGFPAPVDEIVALADRAGLVVVEDCAQAAGATLGNRSVGTFGSAAAFSFYPTKNLGAAGDAGAVATDNPQIADRARRMREYGWDDRRIAVGPGSNCRIDELQAAVLRVMLPRLDAANGERRGLAAEYRERLTDHDLVLPPDQPGAVYHQFAIETTHRDRLRKELRSLGVETGIHYPVGLHRQPRFATGAPQLPETERLSRCLLSLPIQPELARGQIAAVSAAMSEALERCGLA